MMPSSKKTFPLFKVHVPKREALSKIESVFTSGFINEGVEVTELTNALSKVLGTDNLVLTNSCTSSLTLALRLAGVQPGDEVITTAMTCVATNTPILNANAKIVWADIDPKTGMLDPTSIQRKITDKTKAIVVVAWAGTPPNLSEIAKISSRNDIPVILDAAHAFGAEYEEMPIHRWANFTTYSFQAIKHFTTGDGGALVCKFSNDHKRAKALKWFGLDRDNAKDEKGNWKGQQWDVDVEEAGYKFNMNNVSAAIGLSQIPHIKNILASHRKNAALYDELFDGFKPLRPLDRPSNSVPSHWVYAMKIDSSYTNIKRDQLLEFLNAEGIHAGVVHVPNDEYTAFEEFKTELPGLREFATLQLSLPCGWWLDENDVRHIVWRVKTAITKNSV